MRGNPFDDLEELMDRIGRQVEEGMVGGGLQVPGGVPVDVVDAGDEFEVTAELPGYETDDIDLTLSEGTLRLEASRTDESSYTEGQYLRRERSQKATSRRIRLPEPVDEDEVSAGYEQGVLTVRLPKVHGEDESKSIDIE
ncbi:Hsp20/alpha crystallin family protein [Natrarchaeobaculum aegyptiacum]|uniref:Heat-shock protein Hsp20 n=1 Tax=Natrarchaeobaculum aegyptiacum TaxID=745377 RepID=A0A2Z2HWI9_9EURY|nr:Hsp20/alpha crystallin family protein [Natrarchaeobaculum aegyptiacum]ARS89304.1 heat-shock protein Hsp20 [Natrarchaeobaculum aegyptiacum]